MVEITVFSAFMYLEPVQRFENNGQNWNLEEELQQQHEREYSGYVEGDLTAFEEDNSTSNCSSQVYSEQKMCRRCEPYQTREQGACDEYHGCGRNMHERQKRCDQRRKDENQK